MQNDALPETSAPVCASLASLAEQLRDGPLQDLVLLQQKATELASQLADQRGDRVEDLEGLLRLSLSAMQQFHAFTRDFAAVLRELTDAHRHPH